MDYSVPILQSEWKQNDLYRFCNLNDNEKIFTDFSIAIAIEIESSAQILQQEWKWNNLYRFCDPNGNGIIYTKSAIRMEIDNLYRLGLGHPSATWA